MKKLKYPQAEGKRRMPTNPSGETDRKKGNKMKANAVFFRCMAAIILAFLGAFSIQSDRLFAQVASDPEYNFEFLWKTLDVNYALFEAKHIDWQALYNVYRPRVSAKTSDDELFAVMSRMLGHLNDNHVRLTSASPARFFGAGYLQDLFGKSGIARLRILLRTRPVPDQNFKAPLKESADKTFAHAWLDDAIGYLHFNAFSDAEGSAKAIDDILAEFKDARALVVDVRRNGGGDDRIGKLLAGRFADRKRLYMTTQDRNGPRHADFDPKRHFFVEPEGPRQFTQTVILLIDRLSISAAENFTLAMRILPHVTVVGDFTSGCFADNYNVRLPNGWNLSLSKNLFLDQNGFCWEGIGVPPDIKVSCDYDQAGGGDDPTLATAIALIRSGKLGPQDECKNVRPSESLALLLEKEIAGSGIDQALAGFARRKAQAPDGIHYLDFFELAALVTKLHATGQSEAAEKVLSATSRCFTDVSAIHESLGREYLKQNKKILARDSLAKALELKRDKLSPLAHQFIEYLADSLISAYISGGGGALERRYRELQRQYPQQVGERLLNDIGYYLLFDNLTEPAIQLLRLNVKKFPRSANVYDSLGEAYMIAGIKRLAIRNYEKSLKLDPKNVNAVEMLNKLKEGK
jgi:carboxyl-terminal processing protease